MKRFISLRLVGALALLWSSVGTAATVAVTASNLNPVVGDTFTVTLDAANTVNVGGITLNVGWDASKVTFTSLLTGSPATNCAACQPATGPVGVGTGTFTLVNGAGGTRILDVLPGAPPVNGDFPVAVLTFQAIAAGSMNLVIGDDGGAATGWFDNDTADYIPGTTYTQANITVTSGVAAPDIVVTDSIPASDNHLVDFSPVTVGGNATATVTVTNNGTADLAIGTISAPAETAFSLTGDTCSAHTLAPTENCSITVQFSPALAQAYVGTLDVPSDDPDTATVTVNLTGTGSAVVVPADITVTDSVAPTTDLNADFGPVTVATTADQTITATNDGGSDLTIGTVVLSGASFSVIPAEDLCSGQILHPTESCNISVHFTPAAVQAYAGTVTIPSDDPDEANVQVNIGGTGIAALAPVADVTDSVAPVNDHLIAFGNVTVGGTSPVQTVTVTNTGTAGLDIGQIAGGNPLAAPFIIANDACSNTTVPPAGTCTVEVTFQPTVVGSPTDGFDIPSNAAGSPITFTVSGVGVPVPAPDITVTDSVAPANDLQVGFGAVVVAASQSQTITVTNDGSADLVITGVVAPLAPFSITSNLCTAASPLAPTESCTITVAFTPDVAQVYNGSISISSDDADEDTVVVALSGTGSNGVLVIDGGSSAVDLLSLSLLAGLPLVRRRRR